VRHLLADRRVGLVLSDAALDALAAEGYDPHFGARPLKRTIQRRLQNPLAMQLLEGTYLPGDLAEVGVADGELTFRAVKGDPVHS
jgi:ATP-dependent Clp protease ATP-binding subunit ClpB